MLTHHDLQIRVRYQETDAMGRLHHANYLTYFELGRTEMLRAAGASYREVEEQGLFLVVSEMTCRYMRPRTTMICSPCTPPCCRPAERESSTTIRCFAARNCLPPVAAPWLASIGRELSSGFRIGCE